MLFLGAATVPWIFAAVSLHGSAMSCRASAAPIQVITASFWTTMDSLCGVAINTYPTPPGIAANAPTISNPSQAICELSLTSLFVRVSDWLRVREQLRASQSLSTCRASSIFIVHLLLLEVKPPRWLGVARWALMLVVSHGKVCDHPIDLVENPHLKSSLFWLENDDKGCKA